MKVVVSVGGSVLAPDLDPERVAAHAEVLEALSADGHRVGVVAGGGKTARQYIHVARDLGANEIELDYLGIGATRMNARLLIAALSEDRVTRPAPDYETAAEQLRTGGFAVMGGTSPGQTTDAVSAAFAEYVDADLLVLATSVDGVYDADPKEHADAEKFDSLTAGGLLDVVGDLEMTAGVAAPIDLLAAKIVQRSGMRTVVIDGRDPERVERAIRTGEHEGTDVVPVDGNEDPPEWGGD